MLSGIASSLVLISGVLMSQQAVAHGYTSEPPSRAYACRLGLNKDCGAAQYEPQSVGEAPKGFPALGPADGKIASGGISAFSAMDVQSADRWYKTEIKTRAIEFDWFYTAAHKTTKWEYFITKNDWNPNESLKRSSFDLTPICSFEGHGAAPIASGQAGGSGPAVEKHACQLPADKQGHHVILSLWTVGDTANAFHTVSDVNITADGGPVAPADGWSSVGNITASQTLKVGDKVTARAFVGGTESAQYSVSISVDSEEETLAQNWAFKLAQKVNATQTLIRAGDRDSEGKINPVKGSNKLYAMAESGVTSYQMHVEQVSDPDAFMHVHSMEPTFALEEGRAKVDFNLMTNRQLNVVATVYDAANKQVGSVKQVVNAGTVSVNVDVNSTPGTHTLKLIATSEDGRLNLQDLKSFELTGEATSGGDHDFVYPQGIANYKAGTLVLQPEDGKVYECKPFPYSGWCTIKSHHYVPGVGSNWSDAWIAK